MDTLTAYVIFISTLVFLFYSLKKLIPRLICWQLTNRYSIKFNVETVGIFNLTGLHVSLPADANLFVSRVRVGTSLANWLMPTKFKRPLVILLDGATLTFEKDFGSQLINLDDDSPVIPGPFPGTMATNGWQRDLFAFLENKDWVKHFVWSIEMSDLIVRTSHFEMSIESGHFQSSWNEHVLLLNNSCVKSLIPMTVDDINSDSCCRRTMEVSSFKFTLNRIEREHHYIFRDEIYGQWNPLFHLNVMNVVRSVKAIVKKLSQPHKQSSPSTDRTTLLHFDLTGNVSIGCLLSNEGQSMELRAADFSVVRPAKQRLSIKSNSIMLLCDDNEIASFETVQILYLPESECSSIMNRDDFIGASFVMKKNRILSLAFGKIRITFPYKYDFADTFNERFITMTKWLRKLHGKKAPSDNVAFDVSVDVGHVSIELEDDPFEVKLRNNYELLEDEQLENVKRHQAFDETIDKLLLSRKVTEKAVSKMRLELEKKKAEIYVKRHKQLYQSSTQKRRIFQVQADGVSVKLAADITITSQDKLIRIMKSDLDPVSPFPEDLRFSSIWCRQMLASIRSVVCKLRNFPQPLMEMGSVCLSGRVLGAEQEASHRSRRTCLVDMGPEGAAVAIERTMPSLKIYHDVKLKANNIAYCHGATWDPVLAQLSLCFEKIIKPSRDPSPSLPWWDKMRHIFHGRLIVESPALSMFFHASLDPYNSTELIEVAFTKSVIDWLVGKILVKGNIDFLVHTASKYDECKIVQFPNTSVQIYLNWDCIGNPYDHHSAMPCAPDKLPEYSSNQQHDSYRAFRSQCLNVKLSLESLAADVRDIPAVLLYSNSIRWFENQKQIFAGITRLTRRGKYFGNCKTRKMQFSRLIRKVQVAVMLHKFQAIYWSSSNKTYGCEILGENLSHSAEHVLSLVPFKDGLKRRPLPVWSIAYMNSEITKLEIWLHSNKSITCAEEEADRKSRMYLLSISRVSYNRDNQDLRTKTHETTGDEEERPAAHRLVVHDLRGAWTIYNKEVAFALFDLYVKAQLLKKNLSTEALKGLKVETQSSAAGSSPFKAAQDSLSGSKTSLNKNYAASMLKKLIAESECNPNVEYSEDIENEIMTDEVRLRGMSACQDDDLIHNNWLIELINSQVVLRGCETSGYVIASAAKCQIWQKVHKPVWKERTLLSKGTWVGSVESMQYYATVDAKIDSDVVWLPLQNIQEKDSLLITDLTELVGSGQRVGGVLSLESSQGEAVITGDEKSSGAIVQLQRIISRCSCRFYYVCYTEDLDMEIIREIPPMPEDDDLIEPWDKEVAVDSFTLMHTELDVSTNSQQYAMIIDLVNNLLLFVEPHRKEAVEKMENMRFQFQLTSLDEQKEPISMLQDHLRKLTRDLKHCERECYRLQRLLEDVSDEKLTRDLELERERSERVKAEINDKGDDLAMRVSCFKEAQLLADKDRERQEALASGHFVSSVVKRIEICFRQASWVLTDADGQLQLADITLSNFLYTKIAKNDDAVEHLLELGFIRVLNRLPNQAYSTVLEPTNLADNIPLDRKYSLRIFCRERPPVAGIPIKEHFEVNVVPMTIAVTKAFFKRMLKFFFPEPEEEEKPAEHSSRRMLRRKRVKKEENASDSSSIASAPSTLTVATAASLAVTPVRHIQVTDAEKMRQRALKNQTFVYIKIPEVPITVSYKGGKANHISAIDNFTLILPTIEYHNQTWTWFDVLMSIKNESQKRLLPQAVKQKLTIWPTARSSDQRVLSQDRTSAVDDKDRKARLLLGDAGSPMPSRGSRFRSIFKKQ